MIKLSIDSRYANQITYVRIKRKKQLTNSFTTLDDRKVYSPSPAVKLFYNIMSLLCSIMFPQINKQVNKN